MILTVTLNPAWDITHTVERLEPGASHRPHSVTAQPGGKGVNVSRVLYQLGHPTLATGLTAGASGRDLRVELAASGIPEAFYDCDDTALDGTAAETRRTLTIVEAESGRATVLSEPGPACAAVDWPALLGHLDTLIAGASVVVLTGSLPGGVPQDAYRTLVRRAHAHGVPAIVDADGAALTATLEARPDLVKPNTAELYAATGHRDPVAGGRALLDAGAARVVVSDGPAGLTGLDQDSVWHAVPAPLRPVNPTGAGDAAVAALAVGLAGGHGWPELLRTAAAWSAAAVLEARAGVVAADRIRTLAATVTLSSPAPVTDRSLPPC